MKILGYGNRKQDDVFYDISTPEKEEAAFRKLFKKLDEDWQVYAELAETKEEPVLCEACQKGYHKGCEDEQDCACKETACPSNQNHNSYEKTIRLRWASYYKKAKAGDFVSMKRLMKDRSDRNYEYEQFYYAEVKDATA